MLTKNIKDYVVGKITYKKRGIFNRKGYVLVASEPKDIFGYSGVLLIRSEYRPAFFNKTPVLYDICEKDILKLQEGDIVFVDTFGNFRNIWAADSSQNCLLLTEACNCRCIMCPQPPQKHNSSYFSIAKTILNVLDSETTKEICITGGEPTLFEDEFFEILQICKEKFPQANITLLTNGKKFSRFQFTKRMSEIGLQKFIICVSLHADTDTLHDEITGVKGSFAQTVTGLYNLAKFKHQIEIRHVISNLNFRRLEMFSNFVFRNFPFAAHVAFMGLEITGLAQKNLERIWIDPMFYKENLSSAVLDLNRKAMHASIYNIPLCLLGEKVWKFAKQSISSWKNAYLPICSGCQLKQNCCGIFTTSGAFQSTNICPPKQY